MSEEFGLKRKHVVFDVDQDNQEPGLLPGGMHPDRAAKLQRRDDVVVNTNTVPKVPKTKTAAKQRYLKKSRDKRKKREFAKKAAAPKKPVSTTEDETTTLDPAPEDLTPLPAASTPAETADPTSVPDANEDDEDDEEAVRAKRKLEKKAKRESRLPKEKRKPKALPPVSAEISEEAPPLVPQHENAMDVDEAEASSSRAPSTVNEDGRLSPEMEFDAIPAFPLPQGAPKADPALLNAQALPAALRNATIVDDSTRVGLHELTYQKSQWKGKEKQDTHITEKMRVKLEQIGVQDFFAVQAALLPELLRLPLLPRPEEHLSDYLVSAPTGSGKTLAYAVPLIEILSQRVVTRLRALIVLPTRDLVLQVRETLESLAKGTGLKIGSAAGQHSFAHEQSALVGNLDDELLGGSSTVDILIATPGRLMEHLKETRNFSLQHLRFLVIDEADRLLTQSFQDWLNQVLGFLKPPSSDLKLTSPSADCHDAVASPWMRNLIAGPPPWEGYTPLQSQCQKLLFSATLTTDPSQVAALHLRNPEYILVKSSNTEHFTFPAGLQEKMLVLPADVKPLNLLHLLHNPAFKIDSALCFTKSVDSAERLVNLVTFFEDAFIGSSRRCVAKTYSGELKTGERQKILKDFKDGEINLLVCSDLVARGIDLPSVEHVISYDIPVDLRKYVHRVGRTARAGRQGVAWSLVEKQEARHFKTMLGEHLKQVKKVKISPDSLVDLKESYQIALSRMKDLYAKNTA